MVNSCLISSSNLITGQYWYRDSSSDYIRSSVDTDKCLAGSKGESEKGITLIINDCFDDDDRLKWDIYDDGSIRPRNNELLCIQPSTEDEGEGFYLILDDCRDGYKTFEWISNEKPKRPQLCGIFVANDVVSEPTFEP